MCFGIDHGRERETHLAHPLKRGKGHLIPSSLLCTHTFSCIERPAKAKGPLSLFLPSASSVTASAFGDGAKGELDQKGKGGVARPPAHPLSLSLSLLRQNVTHIGQHMVKKITISTTGFPELENPLTQSCLVADFHKYR